MGSAKGGKGLTEEASRRGEENGFEETRQLFVADSTPVQRPWDSTELGVLPEQ